MLWMLIRWMHWNDARALPSLTTSYQFKTANRWLRPDRPATVHLRGKFHCTGSARTYLDAVQWTHRLFILIVPHSFVTQKLYFWILYFLVIQLRRQISTYLGPDHDVILPALVRWPVSDHGSHHAYRNCAKKNVPISRIVAKWLMNARFTLIFRYHTVGRTLRWMTVCPSKVIRTWRIRCT